MFRSTASRRICLVDTTTYSSERATRSDCELTTSSRYCLDAAIVSSSICSSVSGSAGMKDLSGAANGEYGARNEVSMTGNPASAGLSHALALPAERIPGVLHLLPSLPSLRIALSLPPFLPPSRLRWSNKGCGAEGAGFGQGGVRGGAG